MVEEGGQVLLHLRPVTRALTQSRGVLVIVGSSLQLAGTWLPGGRPSSVARPTLRRSQA